MPTTRRGADSYPEEEQEQQQQAAPAAAASQNQSPAAAAAGEQAPPHSSSNFNTPTHRAARSAARMSEADYEALHACPDESFILRSLQDRMDAVAREQQHSFNQRRLEEELEISTRIELYRIAGTSSTGPEVPITRRNIDALESISSY